MNQSKSILSNNVKGGGLLMAWNLNPSESKWLDLIWNFFWKETGVNWGIMAYGSQGDTFWPAGSKQGSFKIDLLCWGVSTHGPLLSQIWCTLENVPDIWLDIEPDIGWFLLVRIFNNEVSDAERLCRRRCRWTKLPLRRISDAPSARLEWQLPSLLAKSSSK